MFILIWWIEDMIQTVLVVCFWPSRFSYCLLRSAHFSKYLIPWNQECSIRRVHNINYITSTVSRHLTKKMKSALYGLWNLAINFDHDVRKEARPINTGVVTMEPNKAVKIDRCNIWVEHISKWYTKLIFEAGGNRYVYTFRISHCGMATNKPTIQYFCHVANETFFRFQKCF